MPSVRLAIVYYSTYGTNHQMAEIAAEAARAAGAEVRVLKAPETAPEGVVNGQDAWRAQAERTAHVPAATLADLEWANAYLLSAPTRYGAAASQMRAFLDQTGPLWATGKLANKARARCRARRTRTAGRRPPCRRSTTCSATGARHRARRATPTRSPSSRAATRTA
jgi:NAD(P)H dehydrogenase (quinone)